METRKNIETEERKYLGASIDKELEQRGNNAHYVPRTTEAKWFQPSLGREIAEGLFLTHPFP